MTNPLRGETSIDIGPEGQKKTYRLVLDANAFASAQGLLNKKMMEMVADFSADPDDILILRALFWASLQKFHGCHVIEAGELLSDAGPEPVRGAVAVALHAAFGSTDKAEGKEGENPPTATPGIG